MKAHAVSVWFDCSGIGTAPYSWKLTVLEPVRIILHYFYEWIRLRMGNGVSLRFFAFQEVEYDRQMVTKSQRSVLEAY